MAAPWLMCAALALTTLLVEDLAIVAGVALAAQGSLSLAGGASPRWPSASPSATSACTPWAWARPDSRRCAGACRAPRGERLRRIGCRAALPQRGAAGARDSGPAPADLHRLRLPAHAAAAVLRLGLRRGAVVDRLGCSGWRGASASCSAATSAFAAPLAAAVADRRAGAAAAAAGPPTAATDMNADARRHTRRTRHRARSDAAAPGHAGFRPAAAPR